MTQKSAPARRPLIAGNWKMNLNHLEAIAVVQKVAFSLTEEQLTAVEAVLLPSFTSIRSVQTVIEGDRLLIGFGAQDLSPYDSGAYTGDVSGPMLAKLGCTYVVVGHSERREHHGEDDATVNAKVLAALRNGIAPILCVGEKLDVREQGGHIGHCIGQLDANLSKVTAEQMANVVIAYEPVWAIGTGKVATPEDAQEVCQAVRGRIGELYSAETATAARILYGGSVKAANIAGIMAQADVDGALVGGASLDPTEYASMVRFPEHVGAL